MAKVITKLWVIVDSHGRIIGDYYRPPAYWLRRLAEGAAHLGERVIRVEVREVRRG